jgi:hypothetical protein
MAREMRGKANDRGEKYFYTRGHYTSGETYPQDDSSSSSSDAKIFISTEILSCL